MKNNIGILKSTLFLLVIFSALAVVLVAFTLTSCGNNSKQEDSKVVAEQHNDAKFDNAKESDADFLVAAAAINLEEIQLGELAQRKGTMAEVKQLGKMMETEHSKVLKDEQALASKKQITIPGMLTDNGKDAYKKLMDKTGKDFDKAYCDMMVDGHKNAITKFEKASADATDPDIKTWAASVLPGLRAHLDHAITCQAKSK